MYTSSYIRTVSTVGAPTVQELLPRTRSHCRPAPCSRAVSSAQVAGAALNAMLRRIGLVPLAGIVGVCLGANGFDVASYIAHKVGFELVTVVIAALSSIALMLIATSKPLNFGESWEQPGRKLCFVYVSTVFVLFAAIGSSVIARNAVDVFEPWAGRAGASASLCSMAAAVGARACFATPR